MVFSDERTIGDDFADVDTSLSADLVHDLRSISGLVGQFKVTPSTETQLTSGVNWVSLPSCPTQSLSITVPAEECTCIAVHGLRLASVDPSCPRMNFNRGHGIGYRAEAETMDSLYKCTLLRVP